MIMLKLLIQSLKSKIGIKILKSSFYPIHEKFKGLNIKNGKMQFNVCAMFRDKFF